MMEKCLVLLCFFFASAFAEVILGIERMTQESIFLTWIEGKRVGMIVNQTSVDSHGVPSHELLQNLRQCRLTALFTPEHGLTGAARADEKIASSQTKEGVPIYSLYGNTLKPTEEMLDKIDVLIFDIQDIGTRTYTYTTTLFLAMEEAAKRSLPVIVCDRPNPLGDIVDGPLLENDFRSFLGYIAVPLCHGMTVGELARFFNEEYQIGCRLLIVPMKGYKRILSFRETGLPWVPTSPQIPECDTPFYYAMTGILGEFKLLNIGVGYTLPFKVVGAPWIDAETFAKALNAPRFPGVRFEPFHFRPFFGLYKGQNCHGVRIVITDEKALLPATTQGLILGILKSLYPKHFQEAISALASKKGFLTKLYGTKQIDEILAHQKFIAYPLRQVCEKARASFLPIRKKYLESDYE